MDDDIDEVASENEPENEPRFVSEGEWVMPYADAVLILQEKFNATTEDMVTWIETKELIPKDAWLETNVGGRQEVILRWSFADLESNELDSLLDTLYFNENKIKQFEPKNKWLTFKQVLERWPPRDCKNKKENQIKIKKSNKSL